MTVPAQQNPRTVAVGNGVATVFGFGFLALEARDLRVMVDGNEVPQTMYNVAGLGQTNGGQITFLVAPALGTMILISLKVVPDRRQNYQTAGDLLAATVNFDFDRLWLAMQSAYGELGRALYLGLYDADDGTGAYRARGNRIQDVGEPVQTTDAARLQDIITRLSDLAADGSGQFVVERLADTAAPANGAQMVGLAPGYTVRDLLAADPDKGAALVAYLPPTADAYPTTVAARLNLMALPSDYGVVGNGIADDTGGLNFMMSQLPGQTIDLRGRRYKTNGQLLVPDGVTLTNGTIDASGIPNGSYALSTGGSDGAAVTVGALIVYANTITVPEGVAFTAGSWIWIASADIFDFAASTKGEWQRIKSIAGNVLTLFSRLRTAYTTNVRVYQPTMKRGVGIVGVRWIGGGNGLDQRAAHISHVLNFHATNCTFERFHNRDLDIRRSIKPKVIGCNFEDGDGTTGNSYGVCLVNGTQGAIVQGCSGDNKRHLVTVGGENGVDYDTNVSGCTGNNMSDSVIDCHPSCVDFVFANNVGNSLHPSSDPNENRHGMTIQGARGVVTGNRMYGYTGIGYHYQPLTREFYDSVVFSSNSGESPYPNTVGLLVDLQKPGGSLDSMNFSDNSFIAEASGSRGIVVEAKQNSGTISTYRGITLDSNNCIAQNSPALTVRSYPGKVIEDISVTGRYQNNGTTTSTVWIRAENTNGIGVVRVSATVRGGSYGVQNDGGLANRVLVDGCTILGHSTSSVNGANITLGTNITA